MRENKESMVGSLFFAWIVYLQLSVNVVG